MSAFEPACRGCGATKPLGIQWLADDGRWAWVCGRCVADPMTARWAHAQCREVDGRRWDWWLSLPLLVETTPEPEPEPAQLSLLEVAT